MRKVSYPWGKVLLACRSHVPSDVLELLLTESIREISQVKHDS